MCNLSFYFFHSSILESLEGNERIIFVSVVIIVIFVIYTLSGIKVSEVDAKDITAIIASIFTSKGDHLN